MFLFQSLSFYWHVNYRELLSMPNNCCCNVWNHWVSELWCPAPFTPILPVCHYSCSTILMVKFECKFHVDILLLLPSFSSNASVSSVLTNGKFPRGNPWAGGDFNLIATILNIVALFLFNNLLTFNLVCPEKWIQGWCWSQRITWPPPSITSPSYPHL